MLSLFQTLGDHFYPERADFTITRRTGNELSDLLVDSTPILFRRDLGNSLSAMLRDGDWFKMGIKGEADHMGKAWLQWASGRLKDLFDDRLSGFVKSTKEGDHDYVTFGQCVISIELNKHANGLLLRCWHLRDCAWWEDEAGNVAGLTRRWKPTYRELLTYFGEDKVHPKIKEKAKQNPFGRANAYHIVLPSDMYGDEKITNPFVSVWVDTENDHTMEEIGMNQLQYVVPRFQTVSGGAYAYSPATIIALPDARTLQAMTWTLLEAGERYARPPLIATHKVIRGDVDLNPDGITYIDKEYDERLGEALRPMSQNSGGFPIGLTMQEGIKETLASAFYLNKINIPDLGHEMTAYEMGERMKQFRRENLPLFSPIESEYNGQICEIAFEVAMQAGLLGSPQDIPDSLRGRNVVFEFKSPLTASEEETKVNRFHQVRNMVAEAAEIDPTSADNVSFDVALRDAITGTGAPVTWLHPVEKVIEGRQIQAVKQVAEMAQEQNVQ